MKKVIIMLAMLTMTLAASAQFERGRTYVGANLSGLNLQYNGSTKTSFGIDAQAGWFVNDGWLAYGKIGYNHVGCCDSTGVSNNQFVIGVGGRRYFQKTGFFVGAHVDYRYATVNYNDFMPGVEVGYCFFVSHEVAIEPAIYYDQSITNHSDYSTVGLKIGISLFHAKKQLTGAVTDAWK